MLKIFAFKVWLRNVFRGGMRGFKELGFRLYKRCGQLVSSGNLAGPVSQLVSQLAGHLVNELVNEIVSQLVKYEVDAIE